MITSRRFALLASGLTGMLLAIACGGETLATVPTGASDSCVHAEIYDDADEACSTDADCTVAESGSVCGFACSVCPMVMNQSAAARFKAQLSTVSYGACACPATPAGGICVSGQCTPGVRSVAPTEVPDAEVPPRISVSCAQVAHNLCTLANQCTGGGPGGICMVVNHSTTMCLTSVADCVELFSDCELSGGSPGVFPDPTQCDGLLDVGVCTQEGSDMEFTLPPSCVTCFPGSTFPGCVGPVDAG